jgi:GT2 family glycosyltransferase
LKKNSSSNPKLEWCKEVRSNFYPSVLQFSPEATIIYIADNASTDASIAFVQAHFPTIEIAANKANYGFAQGYNEAFEV